MSYEQKYLKYKQKYLQLKSELEGGISFKSLNPFRYKKTESKATDSSELIQYLNERNTLLDEIVGTNAEIKAKQAEIKTLEYNERQAFKKQEADAKLEALKAQSGGLSLWKKSIPESDELKAKKDELKVLADKLTDQEKNLDRLNKLIEAQKKADHYANKLNKTN